MSRNFAERVDVEQAHARVTRHFQSMTDVLRHFRLGERLQPTDDGNPLPQLCQVRMRKFVRQLWLPAKHDLHELRAGRFEIRQ